MYLGLAIYCVASDYGGCGCKNQSLITYST